MPDLIIEQHITSTFRRRELAEGNARDLADGDLINDGQPVTRDDIQQRAINVLQCRQDPRTAETIAAELDAAGLLKGGNYRG